MGGLGGTVNWRLYHLPITCLLNTFQSFSLLLLIWISFTSCFLGHSLCDQDMDKSVRRMSIFCSSGQHQGRRCSLLLIKKQRSVLRESRNLLRYYILEDYILTIVLADKKSYQWTCAQQLPFLYQWGLEWDIVILERENNKCFERKLTMVGKSCLCRRDL